MSNQLALKYPSVPGYKRKGTSERAARAIAPGVKKGHLRIMEVFLHYEMTSIAASDAAGMKRDYGKPRCSEAKALGYLEETGREEYDDSSRFPKEVLRLTDKGRDLVLKWIARGRG